MKKLLLTSILLITPYCIHAQSSPVMVETANVKMKTWQPSIKVTGVIRALNSTTITPEISGKITKMNFQEGDFVKKGTILYELNADILKAELKLNNTNYQLSKLQFERIKSLIKSNAVSQAELDTAKAELEKNEAMLTKTKAQLAQTMIKAPFNGKLGLAKAYEGDFINPGQKLVTLQNNNSVIFEMTIPEIFSRKIKNDLTVNVLPNTPITEKLAGKVSSFDTEIDQTNQSLLVKATVENPNGILMPGSFKNGEIYLSEPKKVLTIPQISVQFEQSGPYVYQVKNNKASKTQITLGPQLGNNVIIISGLNKGDQVVCEGQIKISDGSILTTQKNQKGSA